LPKGEPGNNWRKKKMKKFDMLPILAAFVIAILVFPTLALPVNALTPATGGNLASVVTIPEDDLKRNTGVMVLGLDPTWNWVHLFPQKQWYTDSLCTLAIPAAGEWVGPEASDEPIIDPVTGLATGAVRYQRVGDVCEKHVFAPTWPNEKGFQLGWDLLSQHKILATLNGVPTTPTTVLCEIVEKEKAKIPPQTTKSPSKRQFPDEGIKTTLQDVTDNFVCKFRWIKPGVGALDVYFVGPGRPADNFIADHMLIVTVGYKVGRNTIWASDLQDICILGWSMGDNVLAIGLFYPYTLSTGVYSEVYWSWDDALGHFVSCDEAAAWQLAYYNGGWPYSTN
jgi:hypothetical protein